MKHIVICLDGTATSFGSGPATNVLLLFRLLDRSNICYYQPGVGTLFIGRPDIAPHTRFYTNWQAAHARLDAASGYLLLTHVQAAYLFLVRFYEPGDRIEVFGFSRGCFTARVLAGMLEHVGLLRRGLEEMVRAAWELYAGWEAAGQPYEGASAGVRAGRADLLREFGRTFCRPARIHFMGLWDTVALVGLLRERVFPYTSRSTFVSHVRHAISIDERRCKYRQVPFEEPDPCGAPWSWMSWWRRIVGEREPAGCSDDLVELWFPGNHGDVGGGWPQDAEGYKMSALPLRWIVAEAMKHGVRFAPGTVAALNTVCPVEKSLKLLHHDMLSWRAPKYVAPPALGDYGLPVLPERAEMSAGRSESNSALPVSRLARLLRRAPGAELEETMPANMPSDRTALRAVPASYGAAAHSTSRRRLRSQSVSSPGTQRVVVSKRPNSTGSSTLRRLVEARKGVYTWPNAKITRLPSALYAFVRRQPDKPPESNVQPALGFNTRGSSSILDTIFWWLVELLPCTTEVECPDGIWRRQIRPNFGALRAIPAQAKFHWSLFYRLRYVSDYTPTNIPTDLGARFVELLERTMMLPQEFREDLLKLDANTIRTSDSAIWNIFPDDFAQR